MNDYAPENEDQLQYQQEQQQESGGLPGVIEMLIGGSLVNFVYPNQKGWVFGANTDFEVSGLDTTIQTMQPDVAFVSIERLPFPNRNTVKVAPNLAVEVFSKSDSAYEAEDKVEEYLRAGVKLVWMVRPIKQLIEVYQQGDKKPALLGMEDELDGGEVLPGFKLKVSDIFGKLPPEALKPEPRRKSRPKTLATEF